MEATGYKSKTCATCKESYPLFCFGKNKNFEDGLAYTCRFCRAKNKIPIAERIVIYPGSKRCNKCKKVFLANTENFFTYTTISSHEIRFRAKCKKCCYKYTPDARYRLKYNIDRTYLEKLLESQSNKCIICHSNIYLAQPHKGKNFPNTAQVDHDHITGKIRGLLCSWCNIALGYFKENKESLTNAIEYLNNYK